MNEKSAVERSRRKRTFNRASGIGEKRVLVRTEQDARELEALLKTQLARFVEQHLAQADEMEQFSPQMRRDMEQALLLKGSAEFSTTHGAVSTLFTDMLARGLTAELVPAVAIYTAVYPSSVDYLLKSIPAKVMNYLCRYCNSQAVTRWAEANPEWPARITTSLKDGSFATLLQQIRESIGEGSINYRLLKALEQLCSNALDQSPEDKKNTDEILAQAPQTLLLSPREWSNECNRLRAFILHFMLTDLEARYGDMACRDKTYLLPFYEHASEVQGFHNSRIVTFLEGYPLTKQYTYGVCIGWRFDSWEQFFYQVSHEAVHLLDPKLARNGQLKCSALEEGVAVRYAEEMRETYLPHISTAFVESPAGNSHSPYHHAWLAARKLPDPVLKQIRQTFGSFGSINDPARFAAITADWLTPDEATLLSSDFRYD